MGDRAEPSGTPLLIGYDIELLVKHWQERKLLIKVFLVWLPQAIHSVVIFYSFISLEPLELLFP